MEIKKENLLDALNKAPESVKEVLYALFPEVKQEEAQRAANRPVTERIKTFEDACEELGNSHPFVHAYNRWECYGLNGQPDIDAYLKLRIICAALNEGWQPEFTEDEWRYCPLFYLFTQEEINDMSEEVKSDKHLISTGDYQTEFAGFAYAYSTNVPSFSSAYLGSRLCLKSDTLAVYCGKQFIDLWADFCLIRKGE